MLNDDHALVRLEQWNAERALTQTETQQLKTSTTEPKLHIELWTPYAHVVVDLLKEIRQIGPYIDKINYLSSGHLRIELSSADPLWEARQWGSASISCGLVTQFSAKQVE